MVRAVDRGLDPELSSSAAVRYAGVAERVVGPVSAVLAALYLVLAVAHTLLLAQPAARIMSILAAATALGLGALAWFIHARGIPLRLASGTLAAVVLVAAVNSVAHIAVTGDVTETANVLMVLIAAGAGVLDRRWWWVTVVATWLGWAAAMTTLTAPNWTHWLTSMLIATLLSAVVRIGRCSSIDRASRALRQVEEIAVQDSLTGLSNRRGLDLLGREVMSMAARVDRTVGATFIDVDGLKEVNDTLGHDRGDDVLLSVTAALRHCARTTDVLSRWGGDEFVMIGIDEPPDADLLESRMVAYLRAHPGVPTSEWQPQVSVGTASTRRSRVDLDDLLERADAAMYARRAARRAARVASLSEP